MNRDVAEQLVELYENYIDLGADLMMLEAVIQREGHCTKDRRLAFCLDRLLDYTRQHSEDIYTLSQICVRKTFPAESTYAETCKSSRAAVRRAPSPVWSKKESRSHGSAALHLHPMSDNPP